MAKKAQITLNAVDRLLLIELLPPEDDIITQMLARDIRKKVELSAKDCKLIKLHTSKTGQGMNFDLTPDNISETEMSVCFTEPELQTILVQIAKLDREKKITPVSLDICIKFRDVKIEED